jgi:Tol biopolymer transport system component
MNADGGSPTRLTENPADDQLPAWSPDGSKIAFQSNRGGGGDHFDIWVMNADGSDQHQLTHTRAGAFAPTWSPAGTKLALQSNRSGGTKIFVVNADGTGLAQVTGGSGYGDYVPDWQRLPSVAPSTTTTAPATTTTAPPRRTATTRRRA